MKQTPATECGWAIRSSFVQRLLPPAWIVAAAGLACSAFAGPGPDKLAAVAETNAVVLTNAAQILGLSANEARAHTPVRIRGMVTFYEHGMALFVQDESAGVFVYHTGGRLNVKPGQYVEVSGVANRGRYSPIIDSPRIELIDQGPAVSPRKVSLDEIYLGGLDAQWVELTGVVRVEKFLGGGMRLEMAVPPHRIPVWIPACDDHNAPKFEGNVVTVRGVIGTLCDDQGQLIGFQIFANTPKEFVVVQESPDVFSSRPVQARDLRNPELRRDGVGRILTQGTVTLDWPGRAVFVQDETGGFEVQPKEPLGNLALGSVVEVAGFLGPVLDAPVLEDAVIRGVGPQRELQPAPVTVEDLLKRHHNDELVELEATFLQWADSSLVRPILALQAQGHFLTALLDESTPNGALPPVQPGSRLRLSGVCRLDGGLSGNSPAIHLLLRSPADLKIIVAPPLQLRWGVQIPMAISVLAGLGLVVALWYTQKQRRQTERILQLQASLQAEMLQSEQQLRRSMEERDRIGRDLHDDIIQSIYAVGLNLEDCRRVVRQSPEQAESRVVSAITTLNNTIRSVRGFLAGLEPKVVNGREFKTALKSLALTSGDSPTPFQIEVDPSAANSLTSVQATQLLHIAKEAMSNSLRHGQASSISVSLHPISTGVRLEVRDNGAGFAPEATAGTGHGLRNMTARAREIGANLQIDSAPGQGCCILVTVPQRSPE